MRNINKSFLLLLFILLAISNKGWGQVKKIDRAMYMYIFDKDSLKGFDENAARAASISEGFLGSEFSVRMWRLKRSYLNDKYNLWPKFTPAPYAPDLVERTAVVPGCTNEDFEAATSGYITSNNAIAGWVLSGGDNTGSVGGSTVNTCNLLGCCSQVTSESAIRTTPFIDNTIGGQYPVYSVFGTIATNSAAAAATNTQVSIPLLGNKVIRINDSVSDYSIEKLSKTFAVTAQNALFQFAFISVFATGHSCCDAGSFRIRLYNASGGNTLIPCPTFSVAAPSNSCQPGAGTPDYLTAAASTALSPYIYNPWQISSIDLTPYIGSSITIEIIITDCTGGAHKGYVYFDAQCGPMTVYGNGVGFEAGASTATVPTCGAAGATLCASSGLGPYSWAGPGVTAPYTIPSMANQCYTTGLSGTYTLYMSPAGSCNPIQRIIAATITPAPLLYGSVVQAVCGSTTAIVTLTPSGSASVPSTITWSPSPLTMGSGSVMGTYGIAPSAFIVTITATDPLGCKITITPTINPAAPIPNFTVINVSGTPSITCAQRVLDLKAYTTYTYGTMSYTWQSANTYSTATDEIAVYSPGTFTIVGQDPVSQCTIIKHYTVGINQTPPTVLITPTLQNVSCISTASTVTATAVSPTINTTHFFIDPFGGVLAVPAYTAIYFPGPGSYRDSLVNNLTGCSVVKNFSITTSDFYPIMTVTSPENYTLGCSTHSVAHVTLSGNTTPFPPGGGSLMYALLPNYPFSPSQSIYSITTPGTYTAEVKDINNFCIVKSYFSVVQYTAGPDISALNPHPILNCDTSSTILTAVTSNTNVTFAWSYPSSAGPVTIGTPTVAAGTGTNRGIPLAANYTLTITDNTNACPSRSVVPVLQDLYPPTAVISGGVTFTVTCSFPSAVLTNNSIHNAAMATAGFPTNLPVIANWFGPPPQTAALSSSQYNAFIPGQYTMVAVDLNNGCSTQATTTVFEGRTYPPVLSPAPAVLKCGKDYATIRLGTSSVKSYTYAWSTSLEKLPVTATSDSLRVKGISDEIAVIVTNTINGCSSQVLASSVPGSLYPNIASSQVSGYAPLTVTFNNHSYATADITSSNPAGKDSSGIVTVWSFGNGTQTTTPSSTVSPTATFAQSGVYKVLAYINKGLCQSLDTLTISVDVPSRLEVPNVFTPNDDNINDVFFLKVANMTEIHAVIYDRWGHKVYDLSSTTGNIAWDGTNQGGAKVAAGVYFYTIKGTGKDDKEYNTKGTVTVVR